MKANTLAGAVIAVTLAATSPFSFAADQGNGRITFKGTIIDAPCSIAQESQYQTVPMGQISNVSLKNGGKSNSTPFVIELRGCELGTMKSAVATFSGAAASNSDLLALKGVTGASLAITDHNNVLIKNGTPAPAQAISNGDTFLKFNAYIQGDTAAEGGSENVIELGEFETFANFSLAYQ